MLNKLNTIFQTSTECREKTLPCCIDKKNIEKIYKPDKGIKNKHVKSELFPNKDKDQNPKLSDCIIVYENSNVVLVEIKCGTLTKSLFKDVCEKIENTFKIVKYLDINVTKCILLYKKFDNKQIMKLFTSKSNYIDGKPIIAKRYDNKAIAV